MVNHSSLLFETGSFRIIFVSSVFARQKRPDWIEKHIEIERVMERPGVIEEKRTKRSIPETKKAI